MYAFNDTYLWFFKFEEKEVTVVTYKKVQGCEYKMVKEEKLSCSNKSRFLKRFKVEMDCTIRS